MNKNRARAMDAGYRGISRLSRQGKTGGIPGQAGPDMLRA